MNNAMVNERVLTEKIYEIEQACFSEPWSYDSVEAVVGNPDSVCVVDDYGYVIGMRLQDECELYRIAVLPGFRGKGLGFSLIARFLELCDSKVFLEVAAGNVSAVGLYRKCGFEEIARRKGYYKNDDAIVMRKD